VLGLIAAPFRGAYAASKFAVEALADTLRMELQGSGIHVVLIEPGPIATRFVERAIEAYCRNVDIEASHHRETYRAASPAWRPAASRPTSSVPRPWSPSSCTRWTVRDPNFGYYVTLPAYAVALFRRILPAGALDEVARRN
jgi:NAD(P)-dependent dehydrogenase (short-subunit alcohol dehydrogenase family)